jgi:DNA-binding winged helix-turn-helix (wHTH) protein
VIYRFDVFELDASQYRLLRERTAVEVKPAVLELLVYLIEHRERVVTKQELFTQLWGDRFVSEGALSAAVYQARRALGEEASEQRFIRTLHGRGYQFQFDAVQLAAPAVPGAASTDFDVYLAWAGGPTPLRGGENGIGRDPASVIVIDDSRVSRNHARIVVSSDGAVLDDLGSKNGTQLNGSPVTAATRLSEGDVIEIGGLALTLRSRRADLATLTEDVDHSPP